MRSNFGHIEKISDRKYRVYWPENHRQRSKTIDGSLDDAETFLARKKIDRMHELNLHKLSPMPAYRRKKL